MRIKNNLPSELKYQAVVIESAARDRGLDFFDVVFELLDADAVNGVAAYGGFPMRYPSWRFGMEYERLAKGYQWGLSKIYELVINNDPTYAYLVSSNSLLEQKLVMAHVYGHADFFKHNVWFAHTERNMLGNMGQHAERVRALIDRYGQERVESCMDRLLSLENLIDPYRPDLAARAEQRTPKPALSERRLRSLESFGTSAALPPAPPAKDWPTSDILSFLELHAPLEEWERELLRIVRAEAYYFMPQRLTKVANEGWACYWHSKILTGGLLDASEIIDFADVHAGATAAAPGQFNPYKLGLCLWRYAASQGQDLFLLRRVHNDVSLIDALIDEEFAMRYHQVRPEDVRAAREGGLDWRNFKEGLLRELAGGGQPRIELVEVQSGERGALCLRHHHDGRDLQLKQAGLCLGNLRGLWRRDVELETSLAGQRIKLIAEREGLRRIDLEPSPVTESGVRVQK